MFGLKEIINMNGVFRDDDAPAYLYDLDLNPIWEAVRKQLPVGDNFAGYEPVMDYTPFGQQHKSYLVSHTINGTMRPKDFLLSIRPGEYYSTAKPLTEDDLVLILVFRKKI